MKISAMVSVIPIGVGTSLSAYVAECERAFADAGLEGQLHAHGTNLEGDWDAVLGAIRDAIERVHARGAPRVSVFLKLGTRIDREPSLEEAVRSVREKLARGAPGV